MVWLRPFLVRYVLQSDIPYGNKTLRIMLPYIKNIYSTIMIDWEKEVKEYKTQYEDEDGIHEFVESLVPIYYGDILNTFNEMTLEINEAHIDLPIWQVMTRSIYEDYMDEFMRHWTGFNEEE